MLGLETLPGLIAVSAAGVTFGFTTFFLFACLVWFVVCLFVWEGGKGVIVYVGR